MEDMEGDANIIPDLDIEQTHFPLYSDSCKPCIEEVWREKLQKGLLKYNHFKEYWRIIVPKLYIPGNSVDGNFDDDRAQKELFRPLENFICNGDPQEVFSNLNQLNSPPSICGRVFKMGEPTYSCRDCGLDSTCVLCVDCFKKSTHRNHKYKMGTSSGGGCCDCGDTEAWKSDPFCDIHIAGSEVGQETGKRLPEDMAERVRHVFTAILKYAFQLLTMEHSPGLPSDLKLKDDDVLFNICDSHHVYCTVLYNDESHTFEQVISTLARVIKCSQKQAIEYVTNIDREGRAVVKCSTFPHCTDLKNDIERFTSRHGNRPLKALVVHVHVIAHQFFAVKLLDWLQKILGYAEGFRYIFSEVALEGKSPDISIVEGILLRDSDLWKSARTHWHRLIISGMLMEYESKKAFAIAFTKNYGTVLKDFMVDDQDHSFSIASLSVQIFTVPTLAHHLIAHADVLLILFNTFISECSKKCNKNNKLEFERNVPNGSFKRAQYILYDIRYLLSAKPTVWTDALRKGFLQGISLLLHLLSYMQGMDMVTRQVGQHMEYEPEWESAFNLHIKLAHVITLALDWCGTDKIVLIKAYRATLKKLHDDLSTETNRGVGQVRELADHSASCLQYDVSSQPVSIHLPLTRFLAGLHLHLEKFGLSFSSPEFLNITKPTPEEIMEPVLRTHVMIAQVHAGMWRRNGYSLLNQLYFYHNVKCRTEMLDKDIVLLQIAASLIESNEFLIHVLNKFNLLNWANPDFEQNTLKSPDEDIIRHTTSLVEEFLGLLIMIVGERYTPGIGQVTDDDHIKKEIIQQLCIKPLPHSELNKTLPEDINHETGMERVIDEIAEFKKPSQGTGKGVYVLKSELYNQYNVFFYHYTREELSKSEETQRKRRKQANELECCPPPVLPPLTEAFIMTANLLQCDVMLYVMHTVLERSLNLRARSFSETQLHKILHLIGYALLEEESQNCPFFLFTERAEKWQLEHLIEELCTSQRVEAHKDLLTWTLNKYRKVAAPKRKGHQQNVQQTSVEVVPAEASAQEEKEWRAKMAKLQREKIMAEMAAMQKNFMKENANLFKGTSEKDDSNNLGGSSMDLSEIPDMSTPVALGPGQTPRAVQERTYTCILCQEDQSVSKDAPALVYAAFVQQSTVLSVNRACTEDEKLPDALYLPATLGPAPHTGTCGHVMHSACWQKYFDHVLTRETRRPYRLRQLASFDVEKHEFLCPLCECLSNTALPLIPALQTLHPSTPMDVTISFEDWINALKITLNYKRKLGDRSGSGGGVCEKESSPVQFHPDESGDSTECEEETTQEDEPEQIPHLYYTCPLGQIVADMGDIGEVFSSLFIQDEDLRPLLSENLTEMVLLFAQATYTKGLGVNPHNDDGNLPLMVWKSCSYTIHSLECLLRDVEKPLFGYLSSRQLDCLESLTRISGVIASTWKRSEIISSHCLRLLSMLLEGSADNPCILDWDCFGVLVPLTISMPGLFLNTVPSRIPIPSGNIQELHSLRLLLLCNIVKILLTSDFTRNDTPMEVEEDSTITPICKLLNYVRQAAGVHLVDINSINSQSISLQVQQGCIPFLRCCALFFHFLTGVNAPQSLCEMGGDTYENLCHYLGLPESCNDILGPASVEIAVKWSSHPNVKAYFLGASKKPIVHIPLPVNQLVALPNDYSELINTVSMFACPNSDREDSRNPTMCLVCGDMLCSQSYCCQTELNKTLVGACTYHAHVCGAGVGIFLRVRECEILLLASPNRGCFLSPPYLDEYGETDQGLKRGNPLTLCPERYKKLQLLWLSHGINEEITRGLESSNNLLTTQWQHL